MSVSDGHGRYVPRVRGSYARHLDGGARDAARAGQAVRDALGEGPYGWGATSSDDGVFPADEMDLTVPRSALRRSSALREPARSPYPYAAAYDGRPREDPRARPSDARLGGASYARPYDESAYVSPSRQSRLLGTGASSVAAAALAAVAVVLRVCAIALCVLVVANAAARGAWRPLVIDATTTVTTALPRVISGAFTTPTILDGSFRGDIALSAIILFVGDWLCVRGAASIRGR